MEGAGEFIFIFNSAHDAIMGERALLAAGISVRVMPVPDYLGPACGIALRVNPEEFEKAKILMSQNIKGIYVRPSTAKDTEKFIPWNP
ncbi:MAG: DUF3343 domain-containing protein [Treponema sp.]|jgi:hypothetical protein|nr:DUF3343 domain-containing protein [Treponema sp.]